MRLNPFLRGKFHLISVSRASSFLYLSRRFTSTLVHMRKQTLDQYLLVCGPQLMQAMTNHGRQTVNKLLGGLANHKVGVGYIKCIMRYFIVGSKIQ